MPGTDDIYSDSTIYGKIVVYTVPNSQGTVLTYNTFTKEFSQRSNSEFISDLSLVTTNTVQDITGRKVFVGGTDNEYTGATMEIRGNGTTIFPTLSFHQPSIIAGVISLRPGGFNFMNPNGVGFENVIAKGFYKNGSSDSYILTGGGGHTPISDFASNKYIDYSDTRIIRPNDIPAGKFQYGFTSWANDSYFPYADYIHFGGYPDLSAGEQNLIMFKRNDWGIRQYQGVPQDTNAYSDFVDYWHTGSFNPDLKVNKSGDTMTGALNIKSYSLVGIWKGFNNDTNYMIWRNHTDTKNIAYIGADGNSAASGGGGDGFAIVAPEGRLQLNAQDGVFINGSTPWTSLNFNPNIYVTQSSLITQLGNYATLNGVQTFSNTITFDQSPVIPTGTLGSHAVNLLQLNSKLSALDSATGVGFSGGLATAPFVKHVINGDVLIATQDYADNLINSRVLSENNAVALGFVGATPNTPYVKHANGINVPVATEIWTSNNFITIHSAQNVTGQKTFTVPPKVPSANYDDEAISFGQSKEIAIDAVRTNFLTRTTNLPSDKTFNLTDYGSPMITTIIIKDNNPNGDLYIDRLEEGMTIKILNTTSYNLIIRFDSGSFSTGIASQTWIEVHRDSDGDLIKNDIQNTIIIT